MDLTANCFLEVKVKLALSIIKCSFKNRFTWLLIYFKKKRICGNVFIDNYALNKMCMHLEFQILFTYLLCRVHDALLMAK